MFTLCPSEHDFLPTVDILLKAIGGAGALYLFFVGIKRYSKDQVWKRSEFIAKEIKEFTSDKKVIASLYMLDWSARYIELFPDKEKYDERFHKVDRAILILALQIHEDRIKVGSEDRFTRVEVAIRDHFDQFLFYLERFSLFIELNLISADELKPYLEYWILGIANDIESELRDALYRYIKFYKFKGVVKLFSCYQIDITP